ncbi:uncharacterized protein METZ01_LOCUS357299, partial [marine metagenome]
VFAKQFNRLISISLSIVNSILGFKLSVKYISLGIKSLIINGNASAAKMNLSKSPNCSFSENLGK